MAPTGGAGAKPLKSLTNTDKWQVRLGYVKLGKVWGKGMLG